MHLDFDTRIFSVAARVVVAPSDVFLGHYSAIGRSPLPPSGCPSIREQSSTIHSILCRNIDLVLSTRLQWWYNLSRSSRSSTRISLTCPHKYSHSLLVRTIEARRSLPGERGTARKPADAKKIQRSAIYLVRFRKSWPKSDHLSILILFPAFLFEFKRPSRKQEPSKSPSLECAEHL